MSGWTCPDRQDPPHGRRRPWPAGRAGRGRRAPIGETCRGTCAERGGRRSYPGGCDRRPRTRRPRRGRLAGPAGGPRGAGGRLAGPAPGPASHRRPAPGGGLPLHLLLATARRSCAAGTRARECCCATRDQAEFGRDYRAAPAGVTARHRRGTRPPRPSRSAGSRELLAATARRPAQLGCFGMHEWAMVYRQTQDEVRHNAWPLRLSPDGHRRGGRGERGVRCSHFDAFRFFTAPARPLNVLQPTRETQHDAGAARLPARQHGPLQVGVQALPAGRLGAGRGLLRAGPRDPGAGHAGQPLRPGGARLSAGPDRDRPRAGPSTRPRSGVSPSRPPCSAPAC